MTTSARTNGAMIDSRRADSPSPMVDGADSSSGSVGAPHPSEPEIMNVDDVAAFLRIGRNCVYDAVARNEIPHRRVGKHLRFSRAALMRWLDSCGRSQSAQKGQ